MVIKMTKYVAFVDDDRRIDVSAKDMLKAWDKTLKILKQEEYPPNKIEIEVEGIREDSKVIDIRIRQVTVLGGRALELAEKMKLKHDDLVIVTTKLINGFPEYELEKIEGSPIAYLQKKINRREVI